MQGNGGADRNVRLVGCFLLGLFSALALANCSHARMPAGAEGPITILSNPSESAPKTELADRFLKMEAVLREEFRKHPIRPGFPRTVELCRIWEFGGVVIYEIDPGSWRELDIEYPSILCIVNKRGRVTVLNTQTGAHWLRPPLQQWFAEGKGPNFDSDRGAAEAFNRLIESASPQWRSLQTKDTIAKLWVSILYHYFARDLTTVMITECDKVNSTEAWQNAGGFERELLAEAPEGGDSTRVVFRTYHGTRWAIADVSFNGHSLEVVSATFQYRFEKEHAEPFQNMPTPK